MRVLPAILGVLLLLGMQDPADPIMGPDGRLDPTAFEGKVVYLDFWASWCKPCRASFAWMEDMHERYQEYGLVVVAINLDHAPDDAQHFLDKMKPTFAIKRDVNARMARAYDLEGMPSSYLYDRSGTLYRTHVGFRDRDQVTLESDIRKLLAIPGGASP